LQDYPSVDDVLCAAAEAVIFLIADPMSDPQKLTHRANQNRFLVAGAVAVMDAALASPGCECPDLLKHLKGLLSTPAVDDA
jgi:hypothetical protein